jgi:hypothetical protein
LEGTADKYVIVTRGAPQERQLRSLGMLLIDRKELGSLLDHDYDLTTSLRDELELASHAGAQAMG